VTIAASIVRIVLIPAILLLCVSTESRAAIVSLKHGSTFQGDFISSTDRTLTFHVFGEGQPRTFTRDELTPSSWFTGRSLTAGDNAQAHLKLASFCEQNKLIMGAELELSKAVEIDPSLKDEVDKRYAALRNDHAKLLTETAQHAMDQGQPILADQLSSRVVSHYPDSSSAAEAKTIFASTQKIATQRRDASRAQTEKLEDNEWKGTLKQIHDQMDAGAKRNTDGLNSTQQDQQVEDLTIGIRDYRHAIAQLDGLVKTNSVPAEVIGQATAMKKDCVNDVVTMSISLAGVYANRTSYNDAQNVINEALTIAPDDHRLLEYRNEIQSMSASGGWGRRGIRRAAGRPRPEPR